MLQGRKVKPGSKICSLILVPPTSTEKSIQFYLICAHSCTEYKVPSTSNYNLPTTGWLVSY
jgi:hypothetical protein